MSSKRAFSTKTRQVLEFKIGSCFNNMSISSYGCIREVWRARDKLLECPPNFTNASATRYTHSYRGVLPVRTVGTCVPKKVEGKKIMMKYE